VLLSIKPKKDEIFSLGNRGSRLIAMHRHLYAVFYENSSSPGQRAFWSHKRNVCRTHQYAIPMFLSVIVRFSFIDTVGRKDEALSSFVEILKGASGIASGTTKLCYRYLCSSRQQPNLHN
jgi:hypothetical protein